MSPIRVHTAATKEPSDKRRAARSSRTDVILPMNQPWMSHIALGLKNFEFRRYRISENVKRVWFYVTAPESRISHICEIGIARTRLADDEPLPLNGHGNKEFNEHIYEIGLRLRNQVSI